MSIPEYEARHYFSGYVVSRNSQGRDTSGHALYGSNHRV